MLYNRETRQMSETPTYLLNMFLIDRSLNPDSNNRHFESVLINGIKQFGSKNVITRDIFVIRWDRRTKYRVLLSSVLDLTDH